MRRVNRLRGGLAVLLVSAATTAFVIACGDDEVVANAADVADAGAPEGSAPTQDAPSEGSPPTEAGKVDAGPPSAKLQLVNAASDLGPSNPSGALRICYQLGPQESALIWAPLPPLPNRHASAAVPFPGVFIGTGGALDTTGNDLSRLIVVPYLLNAETLQARGLGAAVTSGNDKSCEDLFDADAGGALALNADYWKLPAIPAETFLRDKSYLLALTGCAGDSPKTAAACGAGFTTGAAGIGNLKINIFELDNATVVGADKVGVQFVQASPGLEEFIATESTGSLWPAILTAKFVLANKKFLVGDGGPNGEVKYLAKTELVQVAGITFTTDVVVPNQFSSGLAFSLAQIKQLSYGANIPAGGDYANGKAFTIIAVGDPNTTPDAGNGGANFNTKFFHFLMFPNDPVAQTFDPKK